MARGETRGLSRVFVIQYRAGPENRPNYLDWSRAGAPSWSQGDITQHKVPSDLVRGQFVVIAETQDARDPAELSLMVKDKVGKSQILDLVRQGCAVDVQVHTGVCSDPRDFRDGWIDGKVRVFENGFFTEISNSELGAMDESEQEVVTEEATLSFRDWYELLPMIYTEKFKTEVAQEIIKVIICDLLSCGDCDDPSDGCQKVFAISAPAGSSPGVLPEVIYTEDGFATSGETPIDTLAIGEDPTDAFCMGNYLVVVGADGSIHIANKENILDGTETWTEVATGFTTVPYAGVAVSPIDAWLVGASGYVYKMTDPEAGASATQDAGSATSENLLAIDAYDLEHLVAVGATNTVIYTDNGEDWQAVTGPDTGAAPDILTVAMRTEDEWWVGTDDGKLYYTRDKGEHWTRKDFPGDEVGEIKDIVWQSPSQGWLSHSLAAPSGRLLRTISGGYWWDVQPGPTGSIPASDNINSIAVCELDPNTLFAGGLADDGADGILIKGSAKS